MVFHIVDDNASLFFAIKLFLYIHYIREFKRIIQAVRFEDPLRIKTRLEF